MPWKCKKCKQDVDDDRKTCPSPICKKAKTAWTVFHDQERVIRLPSKKFSVMRGASALTWARVEMVEVKRALALVEGSYEATEGDDWDPTTEVAFQTWAKEVHTKGDLLDNFSEQDGRVYPSPKGLRILFRGAVAKKTEQLADPVVGGEVETGHGLTEEAFIDLSNVEVVGGGLASSSGAAGYDADEWSDTVEVRAMHISRAVYLAAHERYPAPDDLLQVRVQPLKTKPDKRNVVLTPLYLKQPAEPQTFPFPDVEVTAAGHFDARFLFVFGDAGGPRSDDPWEDPFPGVQVVDISDETKYGFAPRVQVQALRKKVKEVSVVPSPPSFIDFYVTPEGYEHDRFETSPRTISVPQGHPIILNWRVACAERTRLEVLRMDGTTLKVAEEEVLPDMVSLQIRKATVMPEENGETYRLYASNEAGENRCLRDLQVFLTPPRTDGLDAVFRGEHVALTRARPREETNLVMLRGTETETVDSVEAYRAASWVKTRIAPALPAYLVDMMQERGQLPPPCDVLCVRVFPGDKADRTIRAEVTHDGGEPIELTFPQDGRQPNEEGFFSVYFLCVFDTDGEMDDRKLEGVELIDVSQEVAGGYASAIELTAFEQQPKKLTVSPLQALPPIGQLFLKLVCADEAPLDEDEDEAQGDSVTLADEPYTLTEVSGLEERSGMTNAEGVLEEVDLPWGHYVLSLRDGRITAVVEPGPTQGKVPDLLILGDEEDEELPDLREPVADETWGTDDWAEEEDPHYHLDEVEDDRDDRGHPVAEGAQVEDADLAGLEYGI